MTSGTRLEAVKQAAAAVEATAKARAAEAAAAAAAAEQAKEKARAEAASTQAEAAARQAEAERERAKIEAEAAARKAEADRQTAEAKRKEEIAYVDRKLHFARQKLESVKSAKRTPTPEGARQVPRDRFDDDGDYVYYMEVQKDKQLAQSQKEVARLEEEKSRLESEVRSPQGAPGEPPAAKELGRPKLGVRAYDDFPDPVRELLVKDYQREMDALRKAIHDDRERLKIATPSEMAKLNGHIARYEHELRKLVVNDPPYIRPDALPPHLRLDALKKPKQ